MKPETKKDLLTIPNLLTLIRVLCIPFIAVLILKRATLAAFIVTIVSSSTDLFDGYIARKYNQVSNFGKMFDPVADKLLHMVVILCLTIIGFAHWIFIVLFMLKEVTLMLVGGILVAKRKIIVPAERWGKNAALVITIGFFMMFFHDFFAKYLYAA